jgi:hypothetical protein
MSRIPRNAVLAAVALLVFVAVAAAVDLQIVLQSHSTQTVWAVTRSVIAGEQLTSDNARKVQVPQTGDTWDFYTGNLLGDPQNPRRAGHPMNAGTMIFTLDLLPPDVSTVTLSLKTPPPVGKGDSVDVYATVDNRTVFVGRNLIVDSISGNNASVVVPAGDEPYWITLQAGNVALFAAKSLGVGVPSSRPQTISEAVSALSGGSTLPGSISATPNSQPSASPAATPSPRKT